MRSDHCNVLKLFLVKASSLDAKKASKLGYLWVSLSEATKV